MRAREGETIQANFRLGPPGRSGILRLMELRVTPNKHGYLVTGKEAEQSTEEQAVFRTMQDLDHALRAAGLNAETISRMDRRLERGEGFKIAESCLATESLFPQHRRL